nr:unnamed protein product [Callosobruchus analis]
MFLQKKSPKRQRENRRVRFALPPPGGGGGGDPRGHLSPRLTRRRGADRSGVPVVSSTSHPFRGASRVKSGHGIAREAVAVTETARNRQPVFVSVSPAYLDGTLSPTTGAAPEPPSFSACGRALVRAARDADDQQLAELLRKAAMVGLSRDDLNAVDSSGRVNVLLYLLTDLFNWVNLIDSSA